MRNKRESEANLMTMSLCAISVFHGSIYMYTHTHMRIQIHTHTYVIVKCTKFYILGEVCKRHPLRH